MQSLRTGGVYFELLWDLLCKLQNNHPTVCYW